MSVNILISFDYTDDTNSNNMHSHLLKLLQYFIMEMLEQEIYDTIEFSHIKRGHLHQLY
jgi:predicted P-loop ATPase